MQDQPKATATATAKLDPRPRAERLLATGTERPEHPMYAREDARAAEDLRREALSQAVRVELAAMGGDEDVVTRAERYHAFLAAEPGPVVTEPGEAALPPAPTPGRIVLYRLSADDAAWINVQRGAPSEGNLHAEGIELPFLIVRVWGDGSVNGQVILDSQRTFWATSRHQGTGPGTWSWPVRA